MRLDTKPKNDGFWMPGEFEEHKECWMLWPYRPDIWRCGGVYAQRTFAEVANSISEFEPVTVGVMPMYFDDARKRLGPEVRVVELQYNDAWIRDSGPTFVKNEIGNLRGIDWKFNAWGGFDGGAYFNWDIDDRLASRILEIERVDAYRTDFLVLEGGSIHVDGEGTLLTTKQCLLNPNRNPDLTQNQIEEYLRNYLNVSKIIWLEEGLFNDETDGHIDNICCFARPGEVILSWTDDEKHPSYPMCHAAYDILIKERDAKGRALIVHKLELPAPIQITEEINEQIIYSGDSVKFEVGELIPASYVNFLFVNSGIIMPVFKDVKDSKAIKTLESIFPDRRVIAIDSREIILGGGNIHCITQQQPKPNTLNGGA